MGEEGFAVEADREAIALRSQRQRMPLAACHLGVRAGELLTASADDPVKANVVLQGIGAGDIVVVAINQTYHKAARLVDSSGNRLEAGGHLDIARNGRHVDR